MTPAKVLVLAIDAASPVLLERWIGDGTLPNLRDVDGKGTRRDHSQHWTASASDRRGHRGTRESHRPATVCTIWFS